MTLEVIVRSDDWNLMPATELEEVAQNVSMILSTYKFSVPMDRGFGVDLEALDLPFGAAQAKLSAEIASAVAEQEPRARVKKIIYGGDAADGQLNMKVTIEIVEKNLRGGVF